MNLSSERLKVRPEIRRLFGKIWPWSIPATLLLIPALYLPTLARGLVFGDPTEYTFVANVLGIAHPPGYAFYTLIGKIFQTMVPIGDIPGRMHLLSAAFASLSCLFSFATIRELGHALHLPYTGAAAVFTALTVGLAADFWQHAIHANPHIVTATFLAANLFLLTRWWSARRTGRSGDRWLFIFSFSAGLGLTHHPLTVVAFPAYLLFIVVSRPGLWRQGTTLIRMVLIALLGMAVWLYFPIRSPMGPVFGPHDMNTVDGFLDHVLARGLTESLPFFETADIVDRALVFWSLLRLQYSLPIIFLAALGVAWGTIRRPGMARQNSSGRVAFFARWIRHPSGLFGLTFLANYGFVMSLRQQDIMAYLLGLFLIVGLFAGSGVLTLIDLINRRLAFERRAMALLMSGFLLLGPIIQTIRNLPGISLANYDAAERYVESVYDYFEGRDEEAVLLNDWEHMTPLWYHQFVSEQVLSPEDVVPRLVATDRPWVESVYDFLPGGPVYLSGYRSEIVQAGFRLRPRNTFYQVVEPGDPSIPAELTPVHSGGTEPIELIAYQLPHHGLNAGDVVPFTLAFRSLSATDFYYTPVLHLGQGSGKLSFEFTTDGHLVTPEWQPGEVIVERFDFALPWHLADGAYPMTLSLRNLSTGEDVIVDISLGSLEIRESEGDHPEVPLLANFRQRVGLASATVRDGLLQRRAAPWDEALAVERGDVLHLTLEWYTLARAEESYTVFVHLIDLANRPLVTLDYTPLGGSAPTHLWIPKWLPGQRLLDPYRLEIPEQLAAGTYLLEVGLYEMTSGRRLHIADMEGNLAGDRYILGGLQLGSP